MPHSATSYQDQHCQDKLIIMDKFEMKFGKSNTFPAIQDKKLSAFSSDFVLW